MFENIFLKIFWNIFIRLPLKLIDGFANVLDMFGVGILKKLVFQGDGFQTKNLPLPFIAFLVIAAILIIVFFNVNYILALINDDSKVKEKIVTSFKNACKTTIYILMIPVIMFISFALVDFFVALVGRAFGMEHFSFANIIYLMASYQNVDWSNPDFGSINSTFPAPSGLTGEGFTASLIGVLLAGYLMFTLGFQIALKIFEVYLLFIISPVYASFTVRDSGEKFQWWCSSVWSKLLTIISVKLLFLIFAVVIMPMMALAGNMSNRLNTLLLLIFALGGGTLFCRTGFSLVSRLIGESFARTEESSARQASQLGGAVMATGAAVGIAAASSAVKETQSRASGEHQYNKMKQQQHNADGKQWAKERRDARWGKSDEGILGRSTSDSGIKHGKGTTANFVGRWRQNRREMKEALGK